jgi:multidrug efflux pump subunit AcrA (membrane-fusion protein)
MMTGKRWGTAVLLFSLVALVVGCGPAAQPSPTSVLPAATPVLPSRSTTGAVTASGEVVAVQQAQMGFAIAGEVEAVQVTLGDEVQEGDILVALESSTLEAGVAQAQAGVDAAQAQLAELESGPRPEELATAQAAYDAAWAQYSKLKVGPSDQERRIALAALRKAEAALVQAQAAYDEIAWMEEVSEMPQTLALQQATLDYESALASYELVTQGASAEDLAISWSSVESAKAQLDLLKAGATHEQLDAAQAAVAQAEAGLAAARASLGQATLVAPFSGIVADLQVSPGQIVMPGQVVLTLADLNQLEVETTDLSERDVAEVLVGQEATVYVEALNVDVPGRVALISPQASTVGGDVVYTVVIALEEQPQGLRLGMSVEVEIATE